MTGLLQLCYGVRVDAVSGLLDIKKMGLKIERPPVSSRCYAAKHPVHRPPDVDLGLGDASFANLIPVENSYLVPKLPIIV